MTPHVQNILRAAVAVQVAALEWENSDVNDRESHRAIEICLKELQKAVKQLARENA